MTKVLFALLVLGVLGGIFGALLSYASRIFHVETDPRQAAVRDCLAGANCGGCGYPGCDGYAAAVAAGEAPVGKCVAGGKESAEKIAAIMGVSAEAEEKKVAFVPCSGGEDHAKLRYRYTGPKDCRAAMLFGEKSDKLCSFACIGLGNCVEACNFDAIHVEKGVAKVNRVRCVGCGSCAQVCPKGIIRLISASQKVAPACSSCDKGAVVLKQCDVGCIGCMKCQRECPSEAIAVTDNLARVDPEKCTGCGHCAEICPRHIITLWKDTAERSSR